MSINKKNRISDVDRITILKRLIEKYGYDDNTRVNKTAQTFIKLARKYSDDFEPQFVTKYSYTKDSLSYKSLAITLEVSRIDDKSIRRQMYFDIQEEELYVTVDDMSKLVKVSSIIDLPNDFISTYKEEFIKSHKEDLKSMGIKQIKLSDVEGVSIQKEANRIGKKYKDSNEEFEVVGTHPEVPEYNVKDNNKIKTDEEIINILSDL